MSSRVINITLRIFFNENFFKNGVAQFSTSRYLKEKAARLDHRERAGSERPPVSVKKNIHILQI